MKRNLFAEISEGFGVLAKQRAGKATLHTVEVEVTADPSGGSLPRYGKAAGSGVNIVCRHS